MIDFLLLHMIIFAVGSASGWVIELFFRRYIDPVERLKKKFVNPGFLSGPCLPVYGFGFIMLYWLAHIQIPVFHDQPILQKILLYLIMTAIITTIEFIAGMIFVNGMHLELWDYKPYWGNIKGVICPLFSCFWFLASAFYDIVVHKYLILLTDFVFDNRSYLLFVGVFYGIFSVDLVYSFKIVAKLKSLAENYNIVVRLYDFRNKFTDLRVAKKRRANFFPTENDEEITEEVFTRHRDSITSKRKIHLPGKKNKDANVTK